MKIKEYIEYHYKWDCPHCEAPNERDTLIQREYLKCGNCGTQIKRKCLYENDWEIVIEEMPQ